LSAGFGWQLGAFDTWDAVGVDETVKAMETAGKKPAQWVYEMLESGITSFYKIEKGQKYFYNISEKTYNTFNQYVMLSFIWNFNKNGKPMEY